MDRAPVAGALYKQAVQRIEVIESRMDDRLEKIAALHERIVRLIEDDEDEEILLLL